MDTVSSSFDEYSASDRHSHSCMALAPSLSAVSIERLVKRFQSAYPATCCSVNARQNVLAIAGTRDIRLIQMPTLTLLETNKTMGSDSENGLAMHKSMYTSSFTTKPRSLQALDIAIASNEYIAVGSATSRIYIFDTSLSLINTYEHERAVNRILWADELKIISASQDGLVKMWDLRARRPQVTLNVASPVKDLQFQIENRSILATANENGNLQLWDLRKADRIRSINAHQGSLLSIDWHPTVSDRLLSAGIDKQVHVWNTTDGTCAYSISSAAAVIRARFRPYHAYQLCAITAHLETHPLLYDFREPYLPLASFNKHCENLVSFVFIENGNSLITVAKDGSVMLQHIASVRNERTHISGAAVDLNPHGVLASSYQQLQRNFNLLEPDSPSLRNGSLRSQPSSSSSFSISREEGAVSKANSRIVVFSDLPMPIFTFDADWKRLAYFSDSYTYDCSEPERAFEHNMAVAEEVQLFEQAFIWKILLNLLQLTKNYRNEFSENLIDDGSKQKTPFLSINRNVMQNEKSDTLDMKTYFEEKVNELCCELVERGDLQTVVTLACIIRNKISFPAEKVRAWFYAYLQLCSRYEMYSHAATIVALCPDAAIRDLSKHASVFSIQCSKCKHGSIQEGARCAECTKPYGRCALCDEDVSDVWAWCQGCGHGGHLVHIREWFTRSQFCPTGCLHRCTFEAAI